MPLPSAAGSSPAGLYRNPTSPSSLLAETAPKPLFGVRIAEVAALDSQGRTIVGQRRIPTLPLFDAAFAAFAQGTLFQADAGYIAVEDVQPGDWLTTANGQKEQVTWVGSATFSPSDEGEPMALTRLLSDSFGVNRPESFISLGSAARVLQAPPHMHGSTDANRMMTPARQFVDGVNVIEFMPPTPVRLFHIGLRRHSAIIAGGLAVESYHPGSNPTQDVSTTLTTVFESLFPHIEKLSELGPLAYTRAPDSR